MLMVRRIPPFFLGYDEPRACVWRVGVPYETGRKILVQNSVHFFGHDRIHAVGARGYWSGGLPGGAEISDGRG